MSLAEAITASRVSLAPMVAVTTAEFRYLSRLLNRRASLYTEMIVDRALLRSPPPVRQRMLQSHCSGEIAQLGGSDPEFMVPAAKLVEQAGFKQININAGCPSPAVLKGSFGASLMLDPAFDGLVKNIRSNVSIPVSVKCRIGVDEHDSFEFLLDFISRLVEKSGVEHVIVHARKAILAHKKTPRFNRMIPPLDYETVYRLKKEFGDSLKVTLNGGVKTADEIRTHLRGVDGVMIGRAIRANPFLLRELDDSHPDRRPNNEWFKERRRVVQQYTSFISELESAVDGPRQSMSFMLQPLQNLFYGTAVASAWKQALLVRRSSSRISATEFIGRALGIVDVAAAAAAAGFSSAKSSPAATDR